MHKEALTEGSKKLFPLLTKFPEYYLAGGTGLALQLGHRVSVDFDLFSDSEIPKNLLDKVRRVFKEAVIAPSVNNPDELTTFVNDVKLTFLRYPFTLMGELIELELVKTASAREIGVMKAYTIGRRASYKDYVDIYAILNKGVVTLPEIVTVANKKYGDQFNDRLFLEQLVSLDDVVDEEVAFLGEPIPETKIRSFLEQTVASMRLD